MSSGSFRRRTLFSATGAGVAGAVLSPAAASAAAGVTLWGRPGVSGAPEVHGVHLQFGADASREVVVSWITPQSVARPRVLLGPADGEYDDTVAAETVTYRDAAS